MHRNLTMSTSWIKFTCCCFRVPVYTLPIICKVTVSREVLLSPGTATMRHTHNPFWLNACFHHKERSRYISSCDVEGNICKNCEMEHYMKKIQIWHFCICTHTFPFTVISAESGQCTSLCSYS